MLYQRCKKHIANPLIEVAGVPICSICGPVEPEEKQRHTKKPKKVAKSPGDFSEITCSLCKKIKKRKKVAGYDYVDELGNKWLRRRCPDCRPAMIYKQNIKRERKLEDRTCSVCSKMFRPKNARHLYCSVECTQAQKKEIVPAPEIKVLDLPEPIPEKVVTTCLYCEKKTEDKMFCDKKCSNAYQYANNEKFRKRLKRVKEELKNSSAYKKWRQYKRMWGDKITSKARLSRVTWKDLDVFFNNCPPNHEIQIIIPLFDENVCGLFVPWNFSYTKKSKDNK